MSEHCPTCGQRLPSAAEAERKRELSRLRMAKMRARAVTRNGTTSTVVTRNQTTEKKPIVTRNAGGLIEPGEPFAQFWQAYPRRVGKGAAEKAWKRLKCNALLPQILVSLRTCKTSADWTKDGGQFIPHPATWLNRKGWEDELYATQIHRHTDSNRNVGHNAGLDYSKRTAASQARADRELSPLVRSLLSGLPDPGQPDPGAGA